MVILKDINSMVMIHNMSVMIDEKGKLTKIIYWIYTHIKEK